MDFFSIDCEIPFLEYKKTIRFHAENFHIPTRPPESHYVVANAAFDKAEKCAASGSYPLAFFYYWRCITIIDNCKLRTSVKEASGLLKKCLDAITAVDAKGLLVYYEEQIQKVRQNEEERKHTVSLQLQLDAENAVDVSGDLTLEQKAHLARREQLLANENARLEAMRAMLLVGTHKPGCGPTAVTPLGSAGGGEGAKELSLGNGHLPEKAPGRGDGSVAVQVPGQSIATRDRLVFRPTSAEASHFYRSWFFSDHSSAGCAPSSVRRGIVNLGNTCYMNSVLQVLAVSPIGEYFLTNRYLGDIVDGSTGSARVTNTFAFVVRELHRENCEFPVSPSPFKNAFGQASSAFDNFSQQDANEFLRTLLDNIHSNINLNKREKATFTEIDNTKGTDEELATEFWRQYTMRNSSEIVRLCAFQERSLLRCPECRNCTRSFNTLMGVDVPIPVTSSAVCIEDCLKAYCGEEVLDADSMYSCAFCKQQVRATKQLSLFSTPEVLFITMKRFRSYGNFSDKVSKPVAFQHTLNLAPFLCKVDQGGADYKLVGIVNHQGNIHGGHYTADALGEDGLWFSFSDERVTQATKPDFRLAYLLCYVKANRK